MKISSVIAAFEDAAQTISGMQFKSCFLFELTGNETYPLTVLTPPESVIQDYRNPVEQYSIELFVMKTLPQSSTEVYTDVWEDLKDWGFDIIDYVHGYLPSGVSVPNMWIPSPKKIVITPFAHKGNDLTPAVKFEFVLEVKDCRNQT